MIALDDNDVASAVATRLRGEQLDPAVREAFERRNNPSKTCSKQQLERVLCRRSFYDFVVRFWDVLIPEPMVDNWHIKVLCDELQVVMERVFKRLPKEYDLIINVPPGSTKSTIASEMLPAWCWANDPTLRFICGSYGYDLSLELAAKCHRVLDSEKFRQLFHYVRLTKTATSLLKTDRGGERITTSTGGAITGFHGHVIIADDPINPKEAVSDVGLKNANDWFDHTLYSRMVDKKITPMILIMQRLARNDPTGHMLNKIREGARVRHVCLPAEVCDGVRPRSFRKFYRDGLFDPVRLGSSVLSDAATTMGQYAYSGQYMQDPIPLAGGMFRTAMLGIRHSAPRLVKVIRSWDKAGTVRKRGRGAWTVGVKMGVDADKPPHFWILDVVRGQWEASEREKVIRQTAAIDGKGVMIVLEQEPGSGGKESAQMTVRNLAGYRIRVDRPVGEKDVRADPFASQVNNGSVYLIEAAWNHAYIQEMMHFPDPSTTKDQVDASSMAFAFLAGRKTLAGGMDTLIQRQKEGYVTVT